MEKILPEYTTSCSTAENLYVEEYNSLSQLTSEPVPTESATKENLICFFDLWVKGDNITYPGLW